MKIDIYRKFSLHKIIEYFLLFSFPVICVCGVSFFPYMLRQPLIYTVGIVTAIFIVVSGKTIRIGKACFLFFLSLAYITVSLTYSYDYKSTLYYLLIYVSAFPLMFFDYSENFYDKMLNVFLVVTTVIAGSILISVVIPNCMNTLFWFIVNPTRSPSVAHTISREVSVGAYSGFAREKGDAAFIMNAGIAVCFARYFSKGKMDKVTLICTLMDLAALTLTGKRTMFTIVVASFCVFMITSKIKGKFIKFFFIALAAVMAVFLVLNFVPSFANIFMRFADTENISSMSGRDSLWKYLYLMIEEHFLFGAGLGSYNNYAYDNGLITHTGKWEYHGHNSYYQGLGELGIFGFILLFGFFLVALIGTFRLMRSEKLTDSQLRIMNFSFYVQLMMFIYAITGNPLYTRQVAYLWFLAISLYLSVYRKHTKDKNLFYKKSSASTGISSR